MWIALTNAQASFTECCKFKFWLWFEIVVDCLGCTATFAFLLLLLVGIGLILSGIYPDIFRAPLLIDLGLNAAGNIFADDVTSITMENATTRFSELTSLIKNFSDQEGSTCWAVAFARALKAHGDAGPGCSTFSP